MLARAAHRRELQTGSRQPCAGRRGRLKELFAIRVMDLAHVAIGL
jgi:hypothetical protein